MFAQVLDKLESIHLEHHPLSTIKPASRATSVLGPYRYLNFTRQPISKASIERPQIRERRRDAETCSDSMESSPGLDHGT
jgi:hypothetical protein